METKTKDEENEDNQKEKLDLEEGNLEAEFICVLEEIYGLEGKNIKQKDQL
jgi:hypothetical protein